MWSQLINTRWQVIGWRPNKIKHGMATFKTVIKNYL